MGYDCGVKDVCGGERLLQVDSSVMQRFEIRRRLGKGAYGIVWKATDRISGQVVALKKIYDAFRNAVDAQRTFREVMFLRAFGHHENIVRLYGVLRAGSDADIYLVFEYMDTDLHRVIKKGGVLKAIHKRFIMYQLLKAIKFLHSAGVVHRDLKPSNILLNAECRAKIADFGLTRSLCTATAESQLNGEQPILTDYVATRWYRAPEILLAAKQYTEGVDMWSLGCILAEMILERPVLPGSSTLDQIELIKSCLGTPDRQTLLTVSTSFSSSLLTQPSSLARRPLRSLFAPNAAPDAISMVSQLLVMHPARRLTAHQALRHDYVKCFHDPDREPCFGRRFVPKIDDSIQLSTDEYRSQLYDCIEDNYSSAMNRYDQGDHRSMKKSHTTGSFDMVSEPSVTNCGDFCSSVPKTMKSKAVRCRMTEVAQSNIARATAVKWKTMSDSKVEDNFLCPAEAKFRPTNRLQPDCRLGNSSSDYKRRSSSTHDVKAENTTHLKRSTTKSPSKSFTAASGNEKSGKITDSPLSKSNYHKLPQKYFWRSMGRLGH